MLQSRLRSGNSLVKCGEKKIIIEFIARKVVKLPLKKSLNVNWLNEFCLNHQQALHTHNVCVRGKAGALAGGCSWNHTDFLVFVILYYFYLSMKRGWKTDKNALDRHKGWRCKGPTISHTDSSDVSHTSIPHPLPLSLPLKLWLTAWPGMCYIFKRYFLFRAFNYRWATTEKRCNWKNAWTSKVCWNFSDL